MARFEANLTTSGYGVDTTSHMPCAWCAAPDFLVAKILDFEEAMKRESTCAGTRGQAAERRL
jgi:hypothetical protein